MQDILSTYPNYNNTVAHGSFAYYTYIGSNSYLDMQDSNNYLSSASSSTCVSGVRGCTMTQRAVAVWLAAV